MLPWFDVYLFLFCSQSYRGIKENAVWYSQLSYRQSQLMLGWENYHFVHDMLHLPLFNFFCFIYLFIFNRKQRNFYRIEGNKDYRSEPGGWIVCSVLWLLLFHYSLSVYVQVDATKRGGIARFINHSCNVGAWNDMWSWSADWKLVNFWYSSSEIVIAFAA